MMEIGQEMHWHKVVSNYGHIAIYRVKVRKIGRRVTVEVPQRGGGVRLASVTPERLTPIPPPEYHGDVDGDGALA